MSSVLLSLSLGMFAVCILHDYAFYYSLDENKLSLYLCLKDETFYTVFNACVN